MQNIINFILGCQVLRPLPNLSLVFWIFVLFAMQKFATYKWLSWASKFNLPQIYLFIWKRGIAICSLIVWGSLRLCIFFFCLKQEQPLLLLNVLSSYVISFEICNNFLNWVWQILTFLFYRHEAKAEEVFLNSVQKL